MHCNINDKMYCDINKAFDLKYQDNNHKHQDNYQDTRQDNIQYNDLNKNNHINIEQMRKKIIQDPNFKQTFFNAQGDMQFQDNMQHHDNNGTMYGTSMSDLKKPEESLSFLDETYGEEHEILNDTEKHHSKKSHNYCIKKFLDYVIFDDNNTLYSNMSSGSDGSINPEIFDHIKKCKYCRFQIKLKINKMAKSTDNDTKIIAKEFIPRNCKNISCQPENVPKTEHFNIAKNYDIKEIISIIIIGIFIIFILDMFVKIGKKSNNL